jgi:predicted GIY-YIG superfamily endonuclease
MEPLIVNALIYVLELEQNKIYVGITYNLNLRYAQHLTGRGAKWTRLYKPQRILEVIVDDVSLKKENEITQKYMETFGKDNVRGGSYCRVTNEIANLSS